MNAEAIPKWKSNPYIDPISCRLEALKEVRLRDRSIEEKAAEFAQGLPALHIRSTDVWKLDHRVGNLNGKKRRDIVVSEIAKDKNKEILLAADSEQRELLEDLRMKGIKVKKTNENFDDNNFRQTSMEQMLFDWWVLRSASKVYSNIWSGFSVTAAAAGEIPIQTPQTASDPDPQET
jgi:hypothetical protein